MFTNISSNKMSLRLHSLRKHSYKFRVGEIKIKNLNHEFLACKQILEHKNIYYAYIFFNKKN